MNSQKHLQKLFAATVLSATLSLGFQDANAAPRNDVKAAKKEVKQERKDVKQARKDVRKADTVQERREAKQDVREERHDVKDARKDVKQEKREERRDDNRWNNNRGTYNNGNSNSNYRTFTGTVSDVDSNGKFGLRVGNQSYDVFINRQLPRNLDRGDTVRVYGVRSGENNIQNATVSIINNR